MEFHRRFLKILYKHLHRQIFKSVEGFKDALFLSVYFMEYVKSRERWGKTYWERRGNGEVAGGLRVVSRILGGHGFVFRNDPGLPRNIVDYPPPNNYQNRPSLSELLCLFFSSNWASICGPLRSVWFVFFYCLFCVVTFHMKQNFPYKPFFVYQYW